MSLFALDWDEVEKMIEKMLNDHMRTWGSYDYFIIDDFTVMVKVYETEDNQRLMFVIKAKLKEKGLEPIEVS
jgi:hypothetical protein